MSGSSRTTEHKAPRKGAGYARVSHLSALCVFILTNLIFAAVYARFLTGSAVYMYADIGNDSLSSSYPLLAMLTRLFHEGSFPFYDLTFGLGTDITALYLQYLNPVKLMILLFPADALPTALLVSTVVQVNLISLFGFIFFRSVLHDEVSAIFPTLAWSYSGYVVLWGQNYSFLTCILLFTMTICLIRLTLAGRKKTITLWLVPVIALFLISNYYFLYMTALFSVFYVIGWGLAAGQKPLAFFKKVGELAVMAAGGAVMGFVALLPIVRTFLDSNRVVSLSGNTASAAQTAAASAGILKTYDLPTYLTFLGRFLSINLFGPGSGYRGAVNYYEAAAAAVSALSLFAIVYLIFRRGSRLMAAALTALCAAVLAFPVCSAVLNMNPLSQRWSFMIAFLECLAIGFFMKAVLRGDRNGNDKALPLTILITPFAAAFCVALILYGRHRKWFVVSPKAALIFGLFFALYEILLPIAYIRKSRSFLLVTVCLALTAELIVANYITVNDRIYMTREAFTESYYNNGAEKTVPAIKAADPDLYRLAHNRQTDPALYGISATADKMFANEGMVNNYAGLSVYTSTVPSSLNSLGQALLSDQGSGNFFIVDYDNYYLFTLLGGRYVFGETSDQPLLRYDRSAFARTDVEGAAESEFVLENTNALPFGYLYDTQLDASDYLLGDAVTRMRSLSRGYVLTSDLTGSAGASNDNAPDAAPAVSGIDLKAAKALKLTDLITMTNDCELTVSEDTLTVTATGADPFVVCRIPETKDSHSLILDLGLDPAEGRPTSLQIFSATQTYPNFGPDLCRDVTLADPGNEFVMLLSDGMTDLRIDTLPGETVTFGTSVIYEVDAGADLAALKASPVSDITWSYDGASPVWSASVDVSDSESSGDSAMLCVPLPYHAFWKASVDGNDVPVSNINGGLLGVALEKGTHQVTLTYHVPHFTLSALISFGAVILFIVVYLLQLRKHRG